jgi:hypothetical protein
VLQQLNHSTAQRAKRPLGRFVSIEPLFFDTQIVHCFENYGMNRPMDRFSVAFACLVVLAVILDMTLNDGTASLFLTQKFMLLIKLVAFWR